MVSEVKETLGEFFCFYINYIEKDGTLSAVSPYILKHKERNVIKKKLKNNNNTFLIRFSF